MKLRLCFLLVATSASVAFGQTVGGEITIDLSYALENQRLAIMVTLGDTNTPEPYLFDTGSPDLTSGWVSGAAWWPAGTVQGTSPGVLTYGAGTGTQQFDTYDSAQSISVPVGTGSLTDSTTVKQVTAEYTKLSTQPSTDWTPDTTFDNLLSASATDPSIHPFSGTFNGTMGADLTNLTTGGFARLVNQQTYGSGLDKGFIVNGSLSGPSLTVGMTASTVASFTNTYAMNMSGSDIQMHPLNGNFTISDGIHAADPLNDIPTLLDTGTPPSSGVFLNTGSALTIDAKYLNGSQLKDGTKLTFLIGDTPYTITSTADNPIDVYAASDGIGGITYGLNFFQNYEVMYDLSTDTVGIQAVPEPGTVWLLALGGVMVVVCGNRRHRVSAS